MRSVLENVHQPISPPEDWASLNFTYIVLVMSLYSISIFSFGNVSMFSGNVKLASKSSCTGWVGNHGTGGPVWVHPEEHSGDSDIKNALKRVTFSHLCLTTPPQSRHEGLNCPYALGGWHTLRLQAQLSAISLLQVWAEEEDGVLPPHCDQVMLTAASGCWVYTVILSSLCFTASRMPRQSLLSGAT